MKKSAVNLKSTASSIDTANSNESSELFDLERDIPMTKEDIRIQRELRRESGKNPFPHIDEFLSARQFENIPPRRTTSKGWEPFELD